jgi:hypothetical protein
LEKPIKPPKEAVAARVTRWSGQGTANSFYYLLSLYNMKLNTGVKIFLIVTCLFLSIAGFLLKLPRSFRYIDKELHTLFYFSAAAFLNILFANRKLIVHILVFGALYFFGVAIEYAQEYSNKFFHKRIHGRYDIEDIRANLKGLVLFSILWIVFNTILFAFTKLRSGKVENTVR